MRTSKEKIWNKNFIIACIANFMVACSFNLLMPAIPLYLSEVLGVEHSQIGIVLSSYAIALLLIRPFCGFWVDVYQRKPLFLFGLVFFIAIYIGYYFAVTVTFFVFFGLSTDFFGDSQPFRQTPLLLILFLLPEELKELAILE